MSSSDDEYDQEFDEFIEAEERAGVNTDSEFNEDIRIGRIKNEFWKKRFRAKRKSAPQATARKFYTEEAVFKLVMLSCYPFIKTGFAKSDDDEFNPDNREEKFFERLKRKQTAGDDGVSVLASK